MDDENKVVRGHLYTFAICPYCDFDNEFAGNLAGENVECEDCEETFKVGEVV